MSQPAHQLRHGADAPAAERHLHVVERPAHPAAGRRRRARVLLVAGVGAMVAVMFALVYLHVVLAQRQIRLDELSTRVGAATTEYQDLRLQVANLESPQQIISVAEGRLGMRQPASVVYVSPPPAVAATPVAPTSAPAPAGDADWPTIKSILAGRP